MEPQTMLKNEKGAAMVEFAIIALVFFSVLFGIIEFSFLLYNQQMITNASREGARAGIVMRIPRVSDSEITNTINSYCQDHLITFGTDNDPVVTIFPADRNGITFGSALTVTVRYSYDFLFLKSIGLGPIAMVSVSRMNME